MRQPPDDLLDDLCNAPDSELGDTENVCDVPNRAKRLYVTAWMLGSDRAVGESPLEELEREAASVRKAIALYEGCGRDLLNRPGRLTVASIAAEVYRLAPADPEQDGRV